MKDSLFGKYCYIDTPGIAGKKTVYRILASGTESNAYCEVPYLFNSKPFPHGYTLEPIVYVVLDTLPDENSEILRFALKDVEIIDDESEKRKHGVWQCTAYSKHLIYNDIKCSECDHIQPRLFDLNFCPNCGADMRGEKNDIN